MTDTMFTRAALTEAAKEAGITPDQARTILEAAGVKVQPEEPALPTKPGSVIIATEVRGVKGKWRMFCDPNGDWCSAEELADREYHDPEDITAWTEATVVPAGELEALAGAQDTLEELAKMGVTEADRGTVLEMAARLATHGITRHDVDRMVKQHYSTDEAVVVPVGEARTLTEGTPDWDDVRNAVASERGNGWSLNDAVINGITDAVMRLLHREEA